jgi:outer membrane receptor protein involved in Fe transport
MYSVFFLIPLFIVPPAPQPIAIREEVSVVADRFSLQDEQIDRSQTLTKQDLDNSASVTVDDSLRKLSGFQLFRRAGSRTANPTAQGASLRGIGSSGASRVLVLYDGVPINDPFGGWIYWGAVPKHSLELIEAYRGGGSDLYGTNALAGIINLIPQKQIQRGLTFSAEAGNQDTSIFNINSNSTFLDTSFRLSAENFRSDGYLLLAPEDRGSVDRPAGSKHTVVELSADRTLSAANFFIRGSYYNEDRENGTELQTNATILRQISSGIHWDDSRFGKFRSTVFGRTQQFDQQFSIVSSTRDTEELASSQQIKANQIGFTSDWLSVPFGLHTLQAGIDAQRVHGELQEWIKHPSDPGTIGGSQLLFGLFLHDGFALHENIDLTIGTRFDFWRNTESTSEVERSESAWSPRISLRITPRNSTELNVSWYRAFRAPTLNELYRPFRLGNTLTLANASLDAEKLTGIEASIHQTLGRDFALRTTIFQMNVDGAITNRTLVFGPDEIIRERDNVGEIRSRGIEVEALSQINNKTRAVMRYQFANSKVIESIVPALQGRRTPQVPYHQASLGIDRSWSKRFQSNVEARYSSSQFEDDLNRFLLESYFTMDLALRYNLKSSWQIFAAAENIFNQRYELGKIPFPTYGAPRLIHGGIQFQMK